MIMGLGNKKGHVHGTNVSGGHSTLIDGADAIVKKLGVLSWFESVRPGMISVARGGKPSVTIRRYADATHANASSKNKTPVQTPLTTFPIKPPVILKAQVFLSGGKKNK